MNSLDILLFNYIQLFKSDNMRHIQFDDSSQTIMS